METQNPPNPATPDNGRSTWCTVLVAGIIASIVFQVLEILLIPLFGGGSPWGPARMIAAMVLGRSVLPPPDTFALVPVLVALVVDIVLAVIYVFILSWFIRSVKTGTALAIGAIFGAGLYAVNFYGFTVFFPWFDMGRNLVTLFTHIIFSVVAVLAYRGLQRPKTG